MGKETNMKVHIIAIGKCKKNSPEAQIIDEYVKRSGWDIVIKEKDNATQEEEAKFLQSSIPQGAKVVVLDERGENIKSLELAHRIENWMLNGCSDIWLSKFIGFRQLSIIIRIIENKKAV